MKNENQEPLLFINYDKEKLKSVLFPIIKETFQDLVLGKNESEKDEFGYITIPAGAKLIKKTTRTIYNWIYAGKLTRYYIEDSPYLKRSELNALPEVREIIKK